MWIHATICIFIISAIIVPIHAAALHYNWKVIEMILEESSGTIGLFVLAGYLLWIIENDLLNV